jgi:hypothetical protein
MRREHGQASTYIAGCKCDDCRKARRDSQRKRRGSTRVFRSLPHDELALLETEPEFFHVRLRAKNA